MKKRSIITILFLCLSLITSAQELQWAHSIGSGNHERGQQIVSDGGAYVYVTGSYWENLLICNDSLPTVVDPQTSNAIVNLFLSKFDSSGNCIWAIPAINIWSQTAQETQVHEMLYHDGYVYLCGAHSYKLVWGLDTLFSTGCTGGCVSTFITKVDTDGNVIWSKTYQGPQRSNAWDMTILDDNIYLTGDFTDSIIFDNITLHETMPGFLFYNGFLAKLDLDGNDIWATKIGTASYSQTHSITDDGHNLYISGEFLDSIQIGNTVFHDTVSYFHWGDYVAKYDTNGNVLWAKAGPDFISGYIQNVDLNFDGVENIYMSAWIYDSSSFGADTFNVEAYDTRYVMSKLDTSANFIWTDATPLALLQTQVAKCEVLPDDQGYYMAVTYSQPMTIENSSFTSAGNTDILLARYDTAANLIWLRHFGGTIGELVDDLHFASGTLYMTGGNMSNFTLDNESLVANGGLDILIARFDDTSYQIPQSVTSVKRTDVSIYPNPANTHVMLKTYREPYSSFTITNAIGQTVMQDNITANEQKIDIQKLPTGIYYMTISGNGNRHVEKLIKIQ